MGAGHNRHTTNVRKVTFDELVDLQDNKELVIGGQYVLIDYEHKYYIENSMTGQIENELENIQIVSGFAFFDPPLSDIGLGDPVEVTELPSGYTGSIQVGDITTISQYFSGGFFVKFANGLHNVVGIKFKYAIDRFDVATSLNGQTITDGGGKNVMTPLGVINTDVHDGTAYMDMTAQENKSVVTEELALTAISDCEISLEAESLTYVGDVVTYDFNDREVKNANGVVIGTRKGFVKRRVNQNLGIDVDKDWRAQRYRRYKVEDTTAWNNYILNNSVDNSLYLMGGSNAFSVSNDNITEEHKYIMPSVENKDFYQDFTKTGTESNVFLTGQATAPAIVYGGRFESAGQEEFRQDLITLTPENGKDFFIFSLDDNYEPLPNVAFVNINSLQNTVFLNLPFQYGESGDLRVDITDGITTSTFMTHPLITSTSKLVAASLISITALDLFYLTNNGLLSNINCLGSSEINNGADVIFLTIGSFRQSVTAFGVSYVSLFMDETTLLRNVIIGGKRVDNLKFSNYIGIKLLAGWSRGQYNTFVNSSSYLTAIKANLDAMNNVFTVDTGTNQNAKKSLFGYYYDTFTVQFGRQIFGNNLGDMLYNVIDGNNFNAITPVEYSLSQ